MIDYLCSGKLALINLVLWLFMLIYYWNKSNSSRKQFWGVAAMLLFFVFGFSEADTYHYYDVYNQMLLYHEPIHVEPFYFWLIEFLPHNYYLWRFVVWGMALFILMFVYKRYGLNVNILGVVFTLILLQKFVVTRSCLGIALFMLAISLFYVSSKSKLLSHLLGVLCVVASVFLHQSLPLFIGIFLLSFIPFNRLTILLSLILFPIIRELLLPYVLELLSMGVFSSETIDFAASYLEDEKSVANTNGLIRQVIELLPFFLMFVLLVVEYVFRKKYIERSIKILFRYSYVLFYVAMLFLGQETSSFISSRTIHMMCFPLVVVVANYISTTNRRNWFLNTSMAFFCIADLFAFLYTIYKNW